MLRKYVAFSICLFIVATVCCQHSPPVFNYKVSDYKAHQQNWSIQQTNDSIMHFGNTDGLLSFNGNLWTLSKLPNNKTIRSLASFGDRIYSGAYGEIGYWEKQPCADYLYHSLNALVPNHSIEKEEIWHIISLKGIVYFQSFSVLLAYDGKTIKKINLPGNIMFLQIIKERILFQVLDQGVFELTGYNEIMKLPNTEKFSGMTVTSILPFKNSELLVTTNSNGIFIYENGVVKDWNKTLNLHFSEVQINKAMISHDGDIVLGTIRDGLMVFNLDGTLKYHINSLNGLQNNTVLSIFEDRSHNLWFGLDRGISIVMTGDQAQRYYDYRGVLGTVYTTAILDSVLYLGTNQGVYYFDQNKKEYNYLHDFKLVKGTQGQVWELKAYAGLLFCGHNEGSFIIKGSSSQKVSSVNGGWYSSVIPNKNDKYIIQSTYTGFVIFSTDNGIKFSHRVEGINIPIKKFVFDDDTNVWAITPNNELYKFSLDSNFTTIIKTKKFGIDEGLPMISKLDIISNDNQIWVHTGSKKFLYDGRKGLFSIETQNNHLSCDDCLVRKIDDTHWALIYKDSVSIYQDTLRINSFNISVNNEYNSIVKLNGRQFVFCLNEGYAITDSKVDQNVGKSRIPLHFTNLEFAKANQCIPLQPDEIPEIPFNQNHIKIHFYKTDFSPDKLFYYKLNDDNQWQVVKDMSFVEFSNLRPNKYKLWIKSSDDHVSEPIEFVILQPWYFSKLAWFFYVLLFFGALKLLKIYFDKKLKQEKIKLESENERLLREHKYELENNRLIQDNLLKSRDLANATMHLVQKNELLQEIKEELIDVRKTGDHTLTTKDFQNLMKIINQNMTVDDDKNLFESNFNDVHEAFFKKLKSEFPELTVPDLKLAAYLKMNLSSKEIAPLFNISIRGLENKRYRLRKKLGLPNDYNLSEYFYNL